MKRSSGLVLHAPLVDRCVRQPRKVNCPHVYSVRFAIVALLFSACLSTPTAWASDSASGEVAVASLAPPVYPPMARVANIWGDVSVTVKIRSDGTVEHATATSGHPILVRAALDNARQMRFECRGCSTATESYNVLYTFRIIKGPDCCSASTVQPTIEHRSQSSTSHEGWETHIIITAEEICLCDPAMISTRKVRSLKCLYLWKCSTR